MPAKQPSSSSKRPAMEPELMSAFGKLPMVYYLIEGIPTGVKGFVSSWDGVEAVGRVCGGVAVDAEMALMCRVIATRSVRSGGFWCGEALKRRLPLTSHVRRTIAFGSRLTSQKKKKPFHCGFPAKKKPAGWRWGFFQWHEPHWSHDQWKHRLGVSSSTRFSSSSGLLPVQTQHLGVVVFFFLF